MGSVSLSPSGEQGIINGSAKLLGEERTKTAQKVDALVVWKASKLIGSEKLPFLRILLPAPVAVRPIILAGAGYVNRLVAQHLAPPFAKSLPPRKSLLSQLAVMVSQLSL